MSAIWTPDLTRRRGPLFTALADAIVDAVQAGRLQPGDRLPPQRDLADALGITVSTVTRGYAEAARRGLIGGEVGRGTYVRPPAFGPITGAKASHAIDLSINTLLPVAHADELVARFGADAGRLPAERLLGYQPPHARPELRAAGAAWLGRAGLEVSPDEVVVTLGAQHALAVVFGTICAPGDEILTEPLTYPGIKAVASLFHLALRPVDADHEGVRPEALEAAATRGRARALYCMPSIQNPTGATMSLRRRREITSVAARIGLTIVEDDTYGFLLEGLPTLCSLAPDYCCYVTTLSKSLAPALRVGFIRAPSRWIDRLAASIFATTVMVAAPGAEVAAKWIADGTVDRVVRWKRAEIAARQRLARRRLKMRRVEGRRYCPHLWLRLPERWTADDYAREVQARGVIITPAREFAVGRHMPNAVRVCLGAAPQRDVLDRALRILAALIDERVTRFSAVV